MSTGTGTTSDSSTPKLVATESKAKTSNPKDLLGNKKVSITKFPMVALIHGAHAMMNGADKYGAYNWRAKDVVASIYVDAAMRHLIAFFEREKVADDSGVHHLGHALATIGILLDAEANGNLIDDRPNSNKSEVIKQVLDNLSEVIVKQRNKKATPFEVAPIYPFPTATNFMLSHPMQSATDAIGYGIKDYTDSEPDATGHS